MMCPQSEPFHGWSDDVMITPADKQGEEAQRQAWEALRPPRGAALSAAREEDRSTVAP